MIRLILWTTFFVVAQVNGQQKLFKDKFDDAIPVLNFGTFHMGFTSDATSVDFDENSQKNIDEAGKIAKMLAEFKPTVIIVEVIPESNDELQKLYAEYLKNPKMKIENSSEINLLGFEIGRLSGAKNIYGIDHKMGYDYQIGNKIANPIKENTYEKYDALVTLESEKMNYENASLLEKLKIDNNPQYLDYLMNVNADMLTYVSSKSHFEGADEAAKFYHRNLRMFSNLNQIPLQPTDRVFILMGSAHTAFFNEFMRRSPKFSLVDPFLYLK